MKKKESERGGEVKTIRFSIRIPEEEHRWLKERMESSREENRYKSMNEEIVEAIRSWKEKKQ